MNGEYSAQPGDPDFERQVQTLIRRATVDGEVIGIRHGHVGQEAIRRIKAARESSAGHGPSAE